MKRYHINIKFRDAIEYDLEFNNKINFIIGNSATGKSTLVEPMIDNPIESITLNGEDIIDSYAFDRGVVPITVSTLLKSEAKVVVFDESAVVDNVLKREKLNKYLNNKIIIVMSRDFDLISGIAINGVTTGTNNYYKLVVNKNNVNVVEPYFKFKKPEAYHSIVTEDSKSGFLFAKKICKNTKSIAGKENLKEVLTNGADLIMVDLCGLNQMVYILNTILKSEDISVVDCYSFEWVILKTNKFADKCDTSLDMYPEIKKNLERYITEVLQEASIKEYDKPYSKGDEEYFDWLFNYGPTELLKGTEYEYLITAYKEIEESKVDRARRLASLLLEE